MYRFFLFLKKISFVVLFVVIEILAFKYYANSNSYTQARVSGISDRVTGYVYTAISGVKHFFSLGAENRKLTEEVARLRKELTRYENIEAWQYESPLPLDSLRYTYTAARVINNSINRAENFMTLNKGSRDGITPDMAIISDGAIAGYVLHCSDKFSTAISVLNTKFRTSGKLAGEDYSAGSLYWDARSYEEMILSEIPKYATIEVGDTVVTTEHSSRFPEGILIGTVKNFELVNGTYYQARVKLFAQMGALNNVVLVRYEDLEEKRALEALTN